MGLLVMTPSNASDGYLITNDQRDWRLCEEVKLQFGSKHGKLEVVGMVDCIEEVSSSELPRQCAVLDHAPCIRVWFVFRDRDLRSLAGVETAWVRHSIPKEME